MAARLRTAAVLGVVAVLTASACAPSRPDPFEIGIKRIVLDLPFADEEKAEPPEPRRVIEVLGLPEETIEGPIDESPRPPRAFVDPPQGRTRCPEAGPNVFPKEPVTLVIRGAPKEGLYRLHNRGTIRITSGAIAYNLPYPSVSTVEIRKVVVTPEVPSEVPDEARGLLGGGNIVTFESTRKFGTVTVIDQYRYDDTKFELLQREQFVENKRTLFRPTPAITLQELGFGNGDDWNSAGVDRQTNVAMVVNGTIQNNSAVDLCGQKYDTLPVVSTEQLVNLATNETSGTDPQQPNIYRFANHHGGLIIQEEGHYTQTLTVDGAPVTAEFDYVATFDSIDPVAP